MVVDVKLNNIPMSFIVDTGANHTFLFNLTQNDSLELKSVKKTMINGLGSSKSVSSFKSLHNKLEVGDLVNNNQKIYLLLDRGINFSSQLGIPIHGIIGSDILENFVTKINYSAKTITFFKPDNFNDKKTKKYSSIDLIEYKKRLFINIEATIDSLTTSHSPTMLLDTGSSDGVWLFENKNFNIKAPKKHFRDFMGTGIGGDIHGKRGRLTSLKIGPFKIEKAKLAVPDSTDIALVYNDQSRQGNIGAEILKRFHIIFDYQNKKMFLKKNHFFNKPFEYNMSGLHVEHNGVRVEKSFNPNISFSESASINSKKVLNINNMFKSTLVPIFEVSQVRKNSPGQKAGIQKGDIVLKINNKPTAKYELSELIALLSERNGKEINLLIERNSKQMKVSFKLERLL